MPVDEFETIARLLRPLTREAPEALDLLDDAAVLPAREGCDLVVTKDAVVQGVHFLPDDPLDLVARKLLRVNLSDLAAKGAEPYGYFLAAMWPQGWGWVERDAFARGLAEDGQAFGLPLLGGDTVTTPGPFTASVTMLGHVPAGGMIRRAGARPGDLLLVSGTVGDGFLGLKAARGEIDDAWLAGRYRLPEPRLRLREVLRRQARAAADVSDGLLADAGHIAAASGCGLRVELERLPLSEPAARWLAAQPDRAAGLLALATGGDDYEVVCAGAGEIEGMTRVGTFMEGEGVGAFHGGAPVETPTLGYRHL